MEASDGVSGGTVWPGRRMRMFQKENRQIEGEKSFLVNLQISFHVKFCLCKGDMGESKTQLKISKTREVETNS